MPEYLSINITDSTQVFHVPQLPAGQSSLFLEWSYFFCFASNQLRLLRSLSDSGSNVSLVDEDVAKQMNLPWQWLEDPHMVHTCHGKSYITKEYMVTFRVEIAKNKFILKKASFLGFKGLKSEYPAYRLQIPAKIRNKFNISDEMFYQKQGPISLVFGSELTCVFPRAVYHEDNICIARSALSGRLLVQGAPIKNHEAKPEFGQKLFNLIKYDGVARVEDTPLSQSILNQILGEAAGEPPLLTDSEYDSSTDGDTDDDEAEFTPDPICTSPNDGAEFTPDPICTSPTAGAEISRANIFCRPQTPGANLSTATIICSPTAPREESSTAIAGSNIFCRSPKHIENVDFLPQLTDSENSDSDDSDSDDEANEDNRFSRMPSLIEGSDTDDYSSDSSDDDNEDGNYVESSSSHPPRTAEILCSPPTSADISKANILCSRPPGAECSKANILCSQTPGAETSTANIVCRQKEFGAKSSTTKISCLEQNSEKVFQQFPRIT